MLTTIWTILFCVVSVLVIAYTIKIQSDNDRPSSNLQEKESHLAPLQGTAIETVSMENMRVLLQEREQRIEQLEVTTVTLDA